MLKVVDSKSPVNEWLAIPAISRLLFLERLRYMKLHKKLFGVSEMDGHLQVLLV